MPDCVERVSLSPTLTVPRLVNGMWQVAGMRDSAVAGMREMTAYHNAGLTAWDMADIYGPAESWFGRFRRAYKDAIGLTKMVPVPGPMSYDAVRRHVSASARRMEVGRLDMVQFHWWDYGDNRYLEAADNLHRLVRDGVILNLGLTNFDTAHVAEFVERGIPVVSNQVQYSILDTRPRRRMARYCMDHEISLLCYGTLLGGLVSKKYLGAPEPEPYMMDTPSLQKYRAVIEAWGGWGLFQEMLSALNGIADKHHSTIPCVAIRYVLEQPCVAAALVGCRLGVAEHISENLAVFGLDLDADDLSCIDSVSARGRDLFGAIGDCGDEYRL